MEKGAFTYPEPDIHISALSGRESAILAISLPRESWSSLSGSPLPRSIFIEILPCVDLRFGSRWVFSLLTFFSTLRFLILPSIRESRNRQRKVERLQGKGIYEWVGGYINERRLGLRGRGPLSWKCLKD